MENVSEAFGISDHVHIDKSSNIILFDDVWTTGSTLKEAAATLKKAGALKVWGLALTR